MEFLPAEAIARADSADPFSQFDFKSMEPLELGLLAREPGEKPLHFGGHRRVKLRRPDAGATVGLFINGYCDIFHQDTVSQFHSQRYRGTTRGFPSSSIATKMKIASVTFSMIRVWKRCAQASICSVSEVFPIFLRSV